MKYLFIVQGEGRGHLTQALSLKEMLQRSGHEVTEVMVGISNNRHLPQFFREQIGTDITTFESVNFLPQRRTAVQSFCAVPFITSHGQVLICAPSATYTTKSTLQVPTLW